MTADQPQRPEPRRHCPTCGHLAHYRHGVDVDEYEYWEPDETDVFREVATIERVEAALRKSPTALVIAGRRGQFNDPWWRRWAEELREELSRG